MLRLSGEPIEIAEENCILVSGSQSIRRGPCPRWPSPTDEPACRDQVKLA